MALFLRYTLPGAVLPKTDHLPDRGAGPLSAQHSGVAPCQPSTVGLALLSLAEWVLCPQVCWQLPL